jgi:hypothetical protein
MKLIAFGDSFVEGLIKEPTENSIEDRANINFVTQLVSLDNSFTSFENYGERGSSNVRIAHRVWKRLQKDTSKCFFLVCWSSPYRYGTYEKNVDDYRSVDLRKEKVTNKHETFETDIFISSIKSLLDYYQVPYLQTNSFAPIDNKLPTEFYTSANYLCAEHKRNTLFDIIANRFLKNENLDEKEYYQNHDFFDVPRSNLIADCKHPTAIGHKEIAKTLNPYIKKIIDNYS